MENETKNRRGRPMSSLTKGRRYPVLQKGEHLLFRIPYIKIIQFTSSKRKTNNLSLKISRMSCSNISPYLRYFSKPFELLAIFETRTPSFTIYIFSYTSMFTLSKNLFPLHNWYLGANIIVQVLIVASFTCANRGAISAHICWISSQQESYGCS